MFLEKILIKGLFGCDDHSINLCKESVTILHAANGEGKTTVLRLVRSVLEGDIQTVAETFFSSIKLEFTDGFWLKVEKEKAYLSPKEISRFKRFPAITFTTSQKESFHFTSIPSSAFFDLDRDDVQDREEACLKKLMKDFYHSSEEDLNLEGFYSFIDEIQSRLSVKLIDTNRLFIDASYGNYKRDAISFYSKDLSDRILEAKQRKELVSDEKDSSLPFRLVTQGFSEEKKDLSLDAIKEKLEKLYRISEKLKKTGLLASSESKNITEELLEKASQNQERLSVLNLVLEDEIEKFACYEKLLAKLELFLKIINRLLSPSGKFMSVSSEGISFYSTRIPKTESEPREIPLSAISSGEKQLFVLFYSLVFMSEGKHNLVLIDEPELSMHISWQEEFIDDLLEICRENSIQAVVSTHSPNIVNGHFELLVGLSEEEEE
jgi:predicted ATP-binding protein involved in virulence